jgi:hypothetical protein
LTTFLAYLGRLIIISFGFCAAVLVALIIVTLPVFAQPDPIETILTATALAMGMIFLGGYLGSLAGLLFLILIGVSEYRGWRDWLTYALAGGALTGGVALLFTGGKDVSILAILTAAGLAGGIAYWLVAGRNAGKLFERIIADRQQ